MNVFRSLLSDKSFWAAVIALATAILTAMNVPAGSIEQIVTLLSAAGVFIAYIISNGIQQAAVTRAAAQRELAQAICGSRQP